MVSQFVDTWAGISLLTLQCKTSNPRPEQAKNPHSSIFQTNKEEGINFKVSLSFFGGVMNHQGTFFRVHLLHPTSGGVSFQISGDKWLFLYSCVNSFLPACAGPVICLVCKIFLIREWLMAHWCQLENSPKPRYHCLSCLSSQIRSDPLEPFYEEEHINLSCYRCNRKEILELFAFEAQTKSNGISVNSFRVIAFTSCFVVI